jgi:hypothetical protein
MLDVGPSRDRRISTERLAHNERQSQTKRTLANPRRTESSIAPIGASRAVMRAQTAGGD